MAAIVAARLTDTLKRVEGQFIRETPSREGLWLAELRKSSVVR